jgi:hypothetical protein
MITLSQKHLDAIYKSIVIDREARKGNYEQHKRNEKSNRKDHR